MAKKDSHLLLFHGAISLASFFAIVFFNSNWVGAVVPHRAAPAPFTVDIGIEHSESMTLSLEMSSLNGESIMDISNKEGEETVALSVPDTWRRREVRNASIEQVTADSSAFGFSRWQLPKGATISFKVPESPEKVILHNPSEKPLKVEIAKVDLLKQAVEKDIVLVQEATAELW